MNQPLHRQNRLIFNRLSIRSKLQAILLLVCLLSILITGYISYTSARQALKASIYEGLTALRVRQAESIEAYYQRIQREALSLSESSTVIQGFRAFKPAFEKLEERSLSQLELDEYRKFYKTEVLSRLSNASEVQPLVDTYLPQANAGRYLQYQYLAKNPFPIGSKYQFNDAEDGTDYSRVHAKFHPKFKRALQLFGYYDIFLVDGETGQVIYTVSKESDFGTNLRTGIYSDTNLGDTFKQVLKSKDPNFTTAVDFESYRPSQDRPAAFIATTVFDGTEFLGSLVFQISIDGINQNMTVNGKWRESGLKNTGQSLLVGRDYTLRSEPRSYVENPKRYFNYLRSIGVTQNTINKIDRAKTPILFQEAKYSLAEKALKGEKGTEISEDLDGTPILVSYQPVQLGPFNWALITLMNQSEAFAPINRLNYLLLASAAVIIPLMVYLANWLSKLFINPIKRLVSASRRLAAGESNVRVNLHTQDELGELGKAFNTMSANLQEKEQNLLNTISEKEELLFNLLPPNAARRYLRGERDFADNYTDVSIIYAEVEGFSELTTRVAPEVSVQLLNELIGAFDVLSETHGVEKLKTVGTTYIAVSGLSISRVDHAKRALDLSVAMIRAVRQFSQQNNCCVTLDIGVHSGPVVGGIVGKSKFIYEVWGDTMKIAYGVHSSPKNNVIQVTESVYLALEQFYRFQPLDKIVLKGIGAVAIWEVDLSSIETEDVDLIEVTPESQEK